MNLKDAVIDLCPPPPPCFLNRMQWTEYLISAAASQNVRGEPKVILLTNGQPQFNREFPYCTDCTQIKSVEMMRANRCNPHHLKEIA